MKEAVKHITHRADDVPVVPFLMERRCTPDRRIEWRGGRRDTDWQNRPLGAWARVGTRDRKPLRWVRLFSALHLW
jgi:hypothetical protein